MFHKTSVAIVLGLLVLLPALAILLGHKVTRGAKGLSVGEELPRAELYTFGGRAVDTGQWRGIPTLLILYQSTCRACEQEIRDLVEIAPAYPRIRIEMLSLDRAPLRFEVPFEVLVDPVEDFIRKTRRLVVPTIYAVDCEGRIREVRSGRSSRAEAQAMMESLAEEENL